MFPVSTAAEVKVIIINTSMTYMHLRVDTSFIHSKAKGSILHWKL